MQTRRSSSSRCSPTLVYYCRGLPSLIWAQVVTWPWISYGLVAVFGIMYLFHRFTQWNSYLGFIPPTKSNKNLTFTWTKVCPTMVIILNRPVRMVVWKLIHPTWLHCSVNYHNRIGNTTWFFGFIVHRTSWSYESDFWKARYERDMRYAMETQSSCFGFPTANTGVAFS